MKKTFFTLLLLLSCIALKAQPLMQGTNEIWYTTTDGNELSIIPMAKHFGNGLTMVFHSYTNGQGIISLSGDVTMIDGSTFYAEKTLKTVTLPSNVKTIGDFAFTSCANLTSINFPEGLTSIGEYAFSSCTSLESVVIPSTVSRIDTMTFNLCYSLSSLVLPASITSIEERAFNQCGNVKTIICDATTPPSVGPKAFLGVDNVTSVTVPSIAVYQENAGWQQFVGKFVDKYLDTRNSQKSDITFTYNNYPSPMGDTVKTKALHDIEYATSREGIYHIGMLSCAKIKALYEIHSITSAYGSKYLDSFVQPYLESIAQADNPSLESACELIDGLKQSAIYTFNAQLSIYNTIRDEVMDTLPTQGTSGPAVKVTKDGKSIILYNPDKVEFIKVTNEE